MKKIIGPLLIIAALTLGYVGVNKITDSESSANILGIEISATDESSQTEGIIYTGLAIVLFVGGMRFIRGNS